MMIRHANYSIIDEESVQYLKNNAAFISLYENQADTIKNILNMIFNSDSGSLEGEVEIIDQINKKINAKFFNGNKRDLVRKFLRSFKFGTIDHFKELGVIYFFQMQTIVQKHE